MWLSLAASVRGTSHVESQTECQDACEIRHGTLAGESVIVFAVCDGAGSARHSDVSANLASAQFCADIYALGQGPTVTRRGDAIAVLEKIRAAIMIKAEGCQCDVREMSTTFLGGCVGRDGGWVCQVGDGGIVIQQDGAFRAVTWPTNGEYANTTTFLTSNDWQSDLQFEFIPTGVDALAAFTDGMQDLILRQADRSVHGPFFTPLILKMREVCNPAILDGPFRAFLGSDAVNARTDDDKTLVLACRSN